ncbi:lytic transglycosylase domain-containing protein [Serratia plymuthica]|jgi:soluble lytic murein transglycosylase-like protein|uniref:lytic transglycosylase domain-containing protein n=1 Tax=Enterobacterales TaxID=91347 RepID=UPI00115CD151|nr:MULTISPECIES: lytic transglycosylase domain-containing protein [Enterobacterales]HCQ0323135.1 lytic transglycosylase domain-containing protein [Escherichia coli]HDR2515681.1 lytic transglycosylase domain-containing protein [Enterobacter ludwigii]MCK7185753.1 lytic transglycosylase domain-containing protein [Enterobacter kobei]MCK7252430.1 lytic transglycosylase domain-containing protein [Enterobacter kobei]MEB6542379.1 lytic transglycosylase domain-containing protein [Serratia plymuthica]
MKVITGLLALLVAGSFSLSAEAFCFKEAGARYQIDPRLLMAIAQQESGMNPTIINTNRNKSGKAVSYDYGVMQVNSNHIPKLMGMGIIKSKDDLLNNPCLNVQIGAWILATHLQKCGVNWSCLGSYNAGFSENNEQETKRLNYARKIYRRYNIQLAGHP